MSKDAKTPKDKDTKDAIPLGTSLLGPIMNLGESVTNANNWRTEQLYLENLQKCVCYFEPRELNERYIPYIFNRMTKGMAEIKQSAQEHLVSFLYDNHITSITNSIMKKLQQEFQASTNYLKRLTFLELYERLARKFSRTFFKTYNLNDLALALGNDKLICVKKKFVSIGILLRTMVFDEDSQMITKVEEGINKVCFVKDKEVARVLFHTSQ
jgi:hypothetical protein